ncbi:MAG: putative Extracellular solute-binding protein family 5 [Candidatus Saccharibacteria bacterium]|nr:putative Extracellular solute-binding protein family 5 [Candidatus Saccharibacteria bacterium]
MDRKRVWKRLGLKKSSKTLQKHARRVEGVTTRHAHRFLISRWDKVREVRLHIILWMSGVGALIAIVGLQMVWFQRSYLQTAPVSGGTYAEAIKGPVETLDPLFATTPAELSAAHLLFSSLFETDTTGHVRGDIASTMIDDGDKVYTVNMRHDARWQDGQQLTASDVVYTVGLMKNAAVHSSQGTSWQGVNVQQVNNYEVKFTLPAAYAAFPQALTFSILPQHVLKSIDPAALREASFSTSPIGSGPFKLRLLQTISQTVGSKIVHMDANDDYYRGRPRLDHLQIHAYADDESIGMALKTGEVTGASDVASDVASTLNNNKYETVIRPTNNGIYAIFNLSNTALKDPIVRKALQVGTNTSAIRKQIYGNPQPLALPFIPYQVAGSNAITPPKFDQNAAAQALDADGWLMHNGVRSKGTDKLQLRVVTRKNNDYETALQILVTQWQKLGVQVTTQIFDTSDPTQNFTTDVLQQRNYDVLLDELVIGGDPDVFAYWDSRGLLNFSGYNSQASDDALTSARTKSDPALRSVKYIAFAKQWLADVPAIGLYQSNYIYVHSNSTEAIRPDEKIVTGDDHYANVLNWTANEGTIYRTP